jgi:hypothetical protein
MHASFTATTLLNGAHQRLNKVKTRGETKFTEALQPRDRPSSGRRAPKQTTIIRSEVHTQSMQETPQLLFHERGSRHKGSTINEAREMSFEEQWRKEMKFDLLSEEEVPTMYDKSQTSPTQPVNVQTDIVWQTSTPPTVSVTMVTEKWTGTPIPHKDIPYCSWIDVSDCPDISKLNSECIESPTIPALDGECKMCPFNWCTGPINTIHSSTLPDQSSVINQGGTTQSPQFGLDQSHSDQGQNKWDLNSVNEPHSTTTTEIPFWNFQTFGP